MKATYKVDIVNPCSKANWNEMAIDDHAGFCSLCTKNVSDLVNWTDEEIIKFLNKEDHKICARLSYEQMGRIISDYETPKINNWNEVVASALLMTSTNFHASEKNKSDIQYDQNYTSKTDFKKGLTHYSTANDTIKNLISGTLIQKESGKPIPNANIEIKDSDINVNTDLFGTFTILIPENYTKPEIVLMVAEDYGFEGQTQRTLYKNQLPITNIIIEKPSASIGEVIFYKPKKWWQFWKKKISITAKRFFKNMMLYLKVIVLDNYYLYRKLSAGEKILLFFI
jgi:hypothetical protein